MNIKNDSLTAVVKFLKDEQQKMLEEEKQIDIDEGFRGADNPDLVEELYNSIKSKINSKNDLYALMIDLYYIN